MTVADIHAIEPLADVYEFDPEKQYIIYVPYDTNIQAMIARGSGLGIRAQIIAVEDTSQIKVTDRITNLVAILGPTETTL